MNRQDIEEFIAWNLHEITWMNNYPINEGVALWCFLNGVKDANVGIKIKTSSLPVKAFYVFNNSGENYESSAEMSKDEILNGWKRSPPASPKSLYDSVYGLIDKLHNGIEKEYPKRETSRELANAMSRERTRIGFKIRDSMESHLLEFFRRDYEAILVPLIGNNPPQKAPTILERLFESDTINLGRINDALADSFGWERGVSSVDLTVAFLKDGIPPETPDWKLTKEEVDERDGNGCKYLIHESSVEDYVWGAYLLELAKLKGYPLKYGLADYNPNKNGVEEDRMSPLEVAYDIGWNILEPLSVK